MRKPKCPVDPLCNFYKKGQCDRPFKEENACWKCHQEALSSDQKELQALRKALEEARRAMIRTGYAGCKMVDDVDVALASGRGAQAVEYVPKDGPCPTLPLTCGERSPMDTKKNAGGEPSSPAACSALDVLRRSMIAAGVPSEHASVAAAMAAEYASTAYVQGHGRGFNQGVERQKSRKPDATALPPQRSGGRQQQIVGAVLEEV